MNTGHDAYGERDRLLWPLLVIVMGSASMIWEIVLLALDNAWSGFSARSRRKRLVGSLSFVKACEPSGS